MKTLQENLGFLLGTVLHLIVLSHAKDEDLKCGSKSFTFPVVLESIVRLCNCVLKDYYFPDCLCVIVLLL